MCFKNLIPVILSGGSGKRLWPASRKTLPKQFKKFNDIDNLFVTTIKRTQKLEECKNLIIVSAKEYEYLIDNHIEDFKNEKKIILEESSKNTAAAIFFSAKEAFEIFNFGRNFYHRNFYRQQILEGKFSNFDFRKNEISENGLA